MKASFIIVNYNRKDELLITVSKIKSLPEFDNNQCEIIIVDNASTDASVVAIKNYNPEVILVESKINHGVSAWNLGFAQAKGNYLVVLDDDSHIESGLDKAFDYLDQNSTVGILALNIKGGAFQTKTWKNLAQYSGFIGCGAIIKKEVFKKIGGYANWIFLYTNEYEYGIRCMEAGYKIVYFADCHVTHRTSSINRSPKRLITYSVQHEMGVVYKYFNKKRRTLFLIRVFLNNLRCVFDYGISSLPWYYKALFGFLKLRKQLEYSPVKPEVELFYSKEFWSTRRFLGIF